MFHFYWPVTAAITLFLIVGVIIVMLRWGPRLCGLRHTALETRNDWEHKTYARSVTDA